MVALGQAVAVADIVLTPVRVITDSRCPINARCVWAGEIIVETRIDGAGWRATEPLRLGEAKSVHGYTLSLTSAEPGLLAGGDPIASGAYRFTFEGQSSGVQASRD